MSNACTTSNYFSGQGAILVGDRDAITGLPTGLRPVGNVSEVTISVETTEFEHKESCTGQRGIDITLTQEINVGLNMTLESINKENLALALFGTSSALTAASVTNQSVRGYIGLWSPLAHVKVSAVVVTNNLSTVTYVLGTDYLLNLEAGSIFIVTGGAITNAQELFVDYSFALQDEIFAVTTGTAPIKYVRFEGLNTADTDKPVVIDLFKVSIKPLAELALISDEISQMALETKVLSDALRTSGSKFFNVRKIA